MALNWFGKEKDVSGAPPKPPENPGNDPLSSDILSGSPPASRSEEIIAGRKRRKDAGQPRGARGEKLSPEAEAMAQAFAELYKPEVWEGIMCSPADTLMAISGRKIWTLSDKERRTLSITGAMTARCFAVENPKWLALILLSINLAQVYGGRIAIHLAERDAERKKEEAAKGGQSAA